MRRLIPVAALAVAAGSASAQQLAAELGCKPTKDKFVYNCVITLKQSGKPLSGAEISMGADMPSMPMAHNVRPVKATKADRPGEYTARLELEMHGEWAVRLRIAGPVRDQLVLNYVFDADGVRPASRGGGHGGHGAKH